jgi:hypothetical protein
VPELDRVPVGERSDVELGRLVAKCADFERFRGVRVSRVATTESCRESQTGDRNRASHEQPV